MTNSVSNVTSALMAEAPFSGTWEHSLIGWSNGPETGGSVDVAPPGLIAIGLSPNGAFITGIINTGAAVIVAAGPQGADQGSIGQIVLTPPVGAPITLNPADAIFANVEATGGPFDGGYGVWIWEGVPGVDTSFVASEVTVVGITANITLTGQAAGNAGTDILLTWDVPNCADTTFEIFELGITDPIATIPQSPIDGFVVMHLDPNTEYTFTVVGDANGTSNTVTVATGCADVENFNCDCAIEPIYQTLAQMRTRMMIRLGYPNQAANPPPGMSALVDAFLYDAQKLIWKQLSRAGLNVERFFRWIMVPGQRYYGISANADTDCGLKLDPYKVTWAGFEDLNRAWYRLTEGVPPEYYTRANINFGWPTHYEIRSCIEIFPAPQAPYTLWVKGDFGLAPFAADDDTATIDDQAVFLLALGMAKAHYGQKDTASVLAQADTYVRGLVAGLHGTRRYVPRTKIQNPATPPRFLPLGDAQA